ncbi:glycosyltransferase family 2 protein [Hydrogenophaga sp.]|uniref:glycosyltransferase family 2 protein n=1 Tax=Hydrogenophaga sp. TaxID=1904254 RepID=UPI003D09837C
MSDHDLLDQVTVVLVTYHSAHCLDALDALLSHCPHIVISDNGSTDGTTEQARARWPQAVVLEHGRNLGFGTANNRAIAQVTTPLAFLLNPDCEVTPEGLRELVRAANELPEVAIVAPQLQGAPGRADVNYRWPRMAWASRGPGAQGPACVGFVVGAAMLFRLARFEGVGFFDERFFLYYEDDDLCLRLFQAQRPMVVWPAVAAVHRARGSVRGKTPWRSEYLRGYHHAQSKLIYAAKHRSAAAAQGLRWSVLLGTTLALPLRVIVFSPKLVARMAGRWMGLWRWRLHD